MKTRILQIIKDDKRYYYRTIKREFPDFWKSLEERGEPCRQLYQWLYLDGREPICETCKTGTPTFLGISLGFNRFCSTKCRSRNSAVRRKTEDTNVQRYGSANCLGSPDIRAKRKSTMLARYGVEHALQDAELLQKSLVTHRSHTDERKQETRERTVRTTLERYGVPNAMQNPDVKEKSKATCRSNHGVDWNLQRSIIKNNNRLLRYNIILENLKQRCGNAELLSDIDTYSGVDSVYHWRCRECGNEFDSHIDDGLLPRCSHCHPRLFTTSKAETEIADFLANALPAETIERGARHIITPWELDIFVSSRRLAIEYHGLYRHCELFNDRLYHMRKFERCREQNIRLLQIYENEWRDKTQIVRGRLQAACGIATPYNARQTTCGEVAHDVARVFMESNHLQGHVRFSKAFGLFSAGELLAVMTFGKPRFATKFSWELLRYASLIGTHVRGGASKLLKHFTRIHSGTIVTYADLRWGDGAMYEKLGFVFSHDTAPSYVYTDKNIVFNRMKFQKHKLAKILPAFDKRLSEHQNMMNAGYYRIYDCGQRVYHYRP